MLSVAVVPSITPATPRTGAHRMELDSTEGLVASAVSGGAIGFWVKRLFGAPDVAAKEIAAVRAEMAAAAAKHAAEIAQVNTRVAVLEQILTGAGVGLLPTVTRLADTVERLTTTVTKIEARFEASES